MSFPDLLQFVTKFATGRFDLNGVLLAIAGFVACFVLIGRFWGSAWNARWGLAGKGSASIVTIAVSVLVALLLLGWHAAGQAVGWLDSQRPLVVQQITSSGESNRQLFRKAWDKLQPLGGQDGLTPPAEGGNEIRLNNSIEARILAAAAAESASSQLLTKDPFRFGAPLGVKDPEAVAVETAAGPDVTFPVVVNPSNNWTRNALSLQAGYAIDRAIQELRSPLAGLKSNLMIAIVVLVLAQAAVVAVGALGDIRENPKV